MQRVILAMTLLACLPAAAQKEELFGTGKPVVYREEPIDKRFTKTKLSKLLASEPGSGIDNPACVQLLGGLFTALAELGPTLHKRDENFYLDPALVDATQQQLSTPYFTAMSYLVAMVRRVMIDKRLPDAWLDTAKAINAKVRIIDIARLRQLNDGLQLVDSAYFQIPLLKERYYREVSMANSAVTTDVAQSFHDDYVNRDVAWGGLTLVDTGFNTPAKGKKVKTTALTEMVAVLEYVPPDPRKKVLDLTSKKYEPPVPIRVYAKLAAKQFLDLEKISRGQRLLVKGRFWEMNTSMTEVEVTDALLFDDRDWGNGVTLGAPGDIMRCPAAINDLTGLIPNQPGGFRH